MLRPSYRNDGSMTQWIRKTCGAVGLAVLCATALQRPAAADFASIREVRSESAAARETRHRRVVERRAGPMIIVHRGASAIAPENSLEAYAAAMDYGADGCEIDFRRTRDGVLVLFHDDMLDRLLDDVGAINELTFAELMKTRPRLRSNRVLASPAPPTFAALLELARQRAMLLHLDIKEPGLEDEIAGLLFPRAASVILTQAKTARAISVAALKEITAHLAPGAEAVADPAAALDRALVQAAADDVVFATGSLYLVGDLRRWWRERTAQVDTHRAAS